MEATSSSSRRVSLLPLVVILVGCCACWGCRAQIPIPARMDGFVYGGKPPAWGETVVVEAFLDPVCPDSRDAWPTLKKVVEHYSSRVSVVAHLFPLPWVQPSSACRRCLIFSSPFLSWNLLIHVCTNNIMSSCFYVLSMHVCILRKQKRNSYLR